MIALMIGVLRWADADLLGKIVGSWGEVAHP